MITFQQYIQEKYPTSSDKKDAIKLSFSEYKKYPTPENLEELNFDGSEWENLEEIKIGSHQIKGTLTISGCPKLKEIYCSNNSLTKVDLSSCSSTRYLGTGTSLKVLNFSNNQLTEIIWPSNIAGTYSDIREINLSNNKFTNFNFLSSLPNILWKLDVSSNSFNNYRLTDLSRFINLEVLKLNNNLFEGSLEPLKNLTRLKELNINDTNISEGWEWLVNMESLTDLYCFANKEDQSRNKVIVLAVILNSRKTKRFSPEQLNREANFAGALLNIRYRNKKKENEELKDKIKELELKKDRTKLIEKLDTLTKKNEELEEKNEELQTKLDDFRSNLLSIREMTDIVVEETEEEISSDLETQIEIPPK